MTGTAPALLSLPLGEPGSGRLRYAAAMTLYRDGALSPEALEVYRICSARDRDDPVVLLRDRGLTVPHARHSDAAGVIRAVIDEADRYLAGLAGPGVAEIRAGIAEALRTGPVAPPEPRQSAVVAAHLEVALAQLRPSHPALSEAIAGASPLLRWITYDSYPRDQIGEAFATGHAFASLIGEDAPVAATEFDFGLFLIAPHVLYRDRCHKAPELYAPLTGLHGWRFGVDRPLLLKPAHQTVWNEPFHPHLTKVGPVPFLALFGWTRDVNDPAQVLRAQDWPALEALRLGD